MSKVDALNNDFHNNIFVVTNHNGRSKLYSFLKHIDFINKPTKKQ
jgi:hypothetical protein